jgi:hypothetical protein
MGRIPHKDPTPGKPDESRSQPHPYKAPNPPPASGHAACQICGLPPEDAIHSVKNAGTESDIHWS